MMRINFGFLVNKFIKIAYRPALRNCNIDKTSKIGMASNCINLKMGKYSYMGSFNSVCNTEVGNFCSIASYCAIGGGEHPLDMISTSPVFYTQKNAFKKCFNVKKIDEKFTKIGNDVWIGEKVFIKAGVKIGNGAVIGAHAVVTHDIPPYAIVAGVPSKILKYRFSEENIKKIEKTEWWNYSEKKLKEIGFKFENIDLFLEEE